MDDIYYRYHDHKYTQRGTGSYSQLFHLLHAHRHAAGLLGDKPAQRQGKAKAQQEKIKQLNTEIGQQTKQDKGPGAR